MKCTTTPEGEAFAAYRKTREFMIIFEAMIKKGILPSKANLLLRVAFVAGWYNGRELMDNERKAKEN